MRLGLALPVGEVPDRGGVALSYRELREVAPAAEDAGLDSIWLADLERETGPRCRSSSR